MAKCGLIFDLNYILYKNVFTLHRLNTLYGDFWNAMTNNINKYTNAYRFDKVILVSDSQKSSWRKSFYTEYKGTRTKDENIDWDWVFEQFNLWKTEMAETYPLLVGDRIEGDDWLYMAVAKGNKKGWSFVTIASDRDILQGCKYNEKKNYINFQIDDTGGKEKLFVPVGWELWYASIEDNRSTDPFELDSSYELSDFFNKMKRQCELVEIDNHEILFTKILMGDKGDNVPSIYKTMTKSGKFQGIGEAGAKKIWNFYKDNYRDWVDTKQESLPDEIIECISKVKNLSLDEDRISVIKENINLSIKLMELNYRHYPDEILEKIMDQLS